MTARAGSSVELGGLARTDQAGYGEEFDRLRHDLMGADPLPGAAAGGPDAPTPDEQRDDGGTR